MKHTQKTDPFMRRALIDPQTVDEVKRTVDVVFATDAPVRTYSYSLGGYFDEILSMDPIHIRQDRLKSGAPVLDDHNRWSGTRGVLGVVDGYSFQGNEGRATLRFAKAEDDPEADKVFRKMKDGILRGISVGYRVFKYEEMNPLRNEGEQPKYRAIDWEPTEISIAPIPADPKSAVRSEGTEQNEIEIVQAPSNEPIIEPTPETQNTENNRNMPDPIENAPVTEHVAPAVTSVDTEAVRQAAIKAERERSKNILDSVRKAKLDDSFAHELIDNGTTIENARALIIDKFAAADPNAGQRNTTTTVGADETDKRRSAQIDALVLRAMPEASMSPEKAGMNADRVSAARNFQGMTLVDLAKNCLERAGEKTDGMSKMDLVGRAITSSSSDFPVLLEGTNRRVLLSNYQAVQDTWRKFCTIGSVSDFRENKRLRMGSFSNLDELNENGEYKNKKITDAEFERISAKTKGNTINVSRQMIINDDLAAFTRLAAGLGRAAARSIEADVFAMFAMNSGNGPVMSDGKTLFHADHGNIATAAALGVTSIDAMRVLMAQQMDPDKNDFLDIRLDKWVGPLGLGSTARILNSSQYDPDAVSKLQRPNIVAGLFSEVVDTPRLSGTGYYGFANPNEEPVFEVAFLDGVQTPFLDSKEGWSVDGMQWKVRLDYGVGAIGWRGVVKNAGA